MDIKSCKNYFIFILTTSLFGCGQPALEHEKSPKSLSKSDDTLARIHTSNTIHIGFSDNTSPFSSLSSQQNQPVGYAIDISQHIANQIKQHLNKPNLTITYHQVKQQDIAKSLQDNLIDFECTINKNIGANHPNLASSVGYFVTSPKFLVKHGQVVKSYQDLKNQNVAVIKGSQYEENLNNFIKKNALSIKIHSVTANELPTLLKEQPIDVVINDDVLLEHLRLSLDKPDDWYITGGKNIYDVYACTLRKSDTTFKKIIDNTLLSLYASGDIHQLYHKWFKSPLPDSNINLNYLLSLQNAELFANPYNTPLSDDISQVTQDISKAFNVDSKVKK